MLQGRTTRTGLLASAALGALLALPAGAGATPDILKTRLPGPVAGTPVDLTVTARDRGAPVTGMIVGFGAGQGGFGLSACTEGPSGPAMPAGRTTTLSAPHTYTAPGAGTAGLKVMSAGCTGGVPATLQRVGYTVVRRGQEPKPSTYSPTTVLPLGQLGPLLPGLLSIPLTPADQAPPGTIAPSSPIQLPALPGVLGVTSAEAEVAAACPGTGGRFRDNAAGRATAQAALLCLTNAERTRRGLRPVSLDGRLTRAALAHSEAMYRRRFFAHTGPGNLTLGKRLRRVRYVPPRGRWLIGENIGFGRGRATSPLALHRAWMRSTSHRANILNGRFAQIGFGVVRQAPFGRGATYTADFGVRR